MKGPLFPVFFILILIPPPYSLYSSWHLIDITLALRSPTQATNQCQYWLSSQSLLRQEFYCKYPSKSSLFFAKMLAVPFYKGTDKQTFRANIYSVAMLSFVKGTSVECQPLPLMHRVVISALIGLLDLLTFVRNTKSPIWPKGNCLCMSYSFSAARHLLMGSVRSTLACSLIQCEIISEHGPCLCQ